MLVKSIVGLIVGAFFTWLAFRGMDAHAVWEAFRRTQLWPVLALTVISFIISLIRSLRWQIILNPVKRIGQRILYPITSVGYMASTLLPARVGELTRPYLISLQGISMSAAIAMVILERIFDSLAIIGLLSLALSSKELPATVRTAGSLFGLTAVLGLLVMVVAYLKRDLVETKLGSLLAFLPSRLKARLQEAVRSFLSGVLIIESWINLLGVFLLTLVLWGTLGLGFYLLFIAFGLDLPPSAALAVSSITALGTALPGAPGFVGTFHYFCILGLVIYGVPKDAAISYAGLKHVITIGTLLLPGIVTLPFVDIKINEMVSGLRTKTHTPEDGKGHSQ